MQKCQSGYQYIIIQVYIIEVEKRLCRNIHVNFSLKFEKSAITTAKKYMKIIPLLRRYDPVSLLQRTIWVFKVTDLT